MIPYDRGEITSYLCDKANITATEYKENGTELEIELSAMDYQRLKEYEIL